MKTRFVLLCTLSFIGGALALPLAFGSANSAFSSHTSPKGRQTYNFADVHQGVARQRVHSHTKAGNGQFTLFDTHCREFSSTTPSPPSGPSDPRYHPCVPTVDSFGITWLTSPTSAQRLALEKIKISLMQNSPNITLDQAAPLIHAAVDNA